MGQSQRKKPGRGNEAPSETDNERFYAEDGSMEISKAGPLTDEDREELALMLAMLGGQDKDKNKKLKNED